MNTPDPKRAKILEIGCATGENILPIAGYYPECSVVGIDPSEIQINRAIDSARRLKLKNISFDTQLRKELLELRTWDYIICHGVFSWVSTDVQNQILSDCKELLTSNGLVLISYNARPGWNLRGTLRHLLLLSSSRTDPPYTQIQNARALLNSLESLPALESTLSLHWLGDELKRLKSLPDAYLFHEYLEEHNHPYYFSEFVEKVQGVGFRYLSDADMTADSLAHLANLPMQGSYGNFDYLKSIQLLDVIANRTFRQSVICHSEIPSPSTLPRRKLSEVYLFGNFRIQHDAESYASIVTQRGNSIRSNNVYFNSILQHLACRYPASTHFQELVDLMCSLTKNSAVHKVEDWLNTMLSNLIAQGDLQISLSEDLFASQFSSTLRIHPYVVRCAQNGFSITNPRHETILLNEETMRFIKLRGEGLKVFQYENAKQFESLSACKEQTDRSFLQDLMKYCLLFN